MPGIVGRDAEEKDLAKAEPRSGSRGDGTEDTWRSAGAALVSLFQGLFPAVKSPDSKNKWGEARDASQAESHF